MADLRDRLQELDRVEMPDLIPAISRRSVSPDPLRALHRSPMRVVVLAAAAMVLVLGGTALGAWLWGGSGGLKFVDRPGTTTTPSADTDLPAIVDQPVVWPLGGVEGTWVRTVFEPGIVVEDLRSTGFGLVAAAGADGVWVSEDGIGWQQAFAAPYQPLLGSPATAAPPTSGVQSTTTTDVPPEPQLASQVKAVVEYDAALYAFGDLVITDPDYQAYVVVWRSTDGRTWDETRIEGSGTVVDAVAGEDGLLVYVRLPGSDRVVYRSADGTEWTRLGPEQATPRGVQIWAVSRFGEGYVALGERAGDRGFVFSSQDGVTWEEVGPWTVGSRADCSPKTSRPPTTSPLWPCTGGHPQPLSYSFRALVDLFDSPYGLVTVGSPGPDDWTSSQGSPLAVMLAASLDGQTFEPLDPPADLLQLQDKRDVCCPEVGPLRGTAYGEQVLLLGHSYPDTSREPTYYQWVWTPTD